MIRPALQVCTNSLVAVMPRVLTRVGLLPDVNSPAQTAPAIEAALNFIGPAEATLGCGAAPARRSNSRDSATLPKFPGQPTSAVDAAAGWCSGSRADWYRSCREPLVDILRAAVPRMGTAIRRRAERCPG